MNDICIFGLSWGGWVTNPKVVSLTHNIELDWRNCIADWVPNISWQKVD